MRSICILAAALAASCCPVLAQQWEVGALGGYSWAHDASIRNGYGSADAGFKSGFAGGVIFGENPYEYIGGELRWMFLNGGPQLNDSGNKYTQSGFANLIHYDLLVHLTRKEDKVRPYIAGGAGIKVYTGPDRFAAHQPLNDFAVIATGNHVEPLISVGGGLKYRVHKGVQLRLDLRAYMSPCPSGIFKTPYGSNIHGWIFDFTPTVGVAYLF